MMFQSPFNMRITQLQKKLKENRLKGAIVSEVDDLKESMTLTLEPGLYFETCGARVEDDYFITVDFFAKLSCFPED